MDSKKQLEILNHMLADSRRLMENGDPLLVGLFAILEARVMQLVSLIEAEGKERDDAA